MAEHFSRRTILLSVCSEQILHHQHGISVAESQMSVLAKRSSEARSEEKPWPYLGFFVCGGKLGFREISDQYSYKKQPSKIRHYVRKKTFSFPGGGNCPLRPPAMYGPESVCFLRLPHSIIAKYVSCRSSKLRQSLKQSIRVNIVQVKPLVRYFSILVKKNVSIMFVFTLFVKARPSVPVIILC